MSQSKLLATIVAALLIVLLLAQAAGMFPVDSGPSTPDCTMVSNLDDYATCLRVTGQ